MDFFRTILASCLSGLLFVICYAPFDLWLLAYIALVPLMVSTYHLSTRRSSLLYGLTGLVLGTGIYYGAVGYGFDALLLITLSFFTAFALWGGLTSWILSRYKSPVLKIFAPAFLWVGIETLSGILPPGVPMYLGLSHSNIPWLIQLSSWFGISAISFLIILANSLVTYVFVEKNRCGVFSWPVLLSSIILITNPLYGYWRITTSSLPPASISVAAIQPHIDSETYSRGWQQPENRLFMQNTLQKLTKQAVSSGAEMVFWAEGGNGHMNMRVPRLREALSDIAKNGKVDLVISSSDMDSDGVRYNSLFSISPSGELLGRYDKQRLLPLAEDNLKQGSSFLPLSTSKGLLGAAICYESTFPEPLRKLTSQGANLLFVTSSEAAFKRSPLALHNAGLAIFRAVENNRWLIRAANTGPSLIVSPLGEVTQRTDFYTRGILSGNVATITQASFYTRAGYFFPLFLAFSVIGLCCYIIFLRLRRHSECSNTAEQNKYPLTDLAPPLITTTLIFVFTITISITSSLYIMNRSSPASLKTLLTELFLPITMPQINTVGQSFLQAGSNTCGAAALAYVLSYLGRETKEVEIVDIVTLTDKGTSMLELKHAAGRLQFTATGVKANYSALENEPLPVIAYINDDHYVVIIDVGLQYINVFDPALGHVRISRNLFEQSWNGYLLLVHPQPIPGLMGVTTEVNNFYIEI